MKISRTLSFTAALVAFGYWRHGRKLNRIERISNTMADSVNQLRTTLDELDVVLQTGQEENANAMQELRSDIENLRKLVDNPAGLNQQIDRLSSRVAAIREASSKNAQAIRDAISTAPADQPPPASETSGETVAENASPENASTATIDSTATDITE